MMYGTAKPISLALVVLVGLSSLLTREGGRFWPVRGAVQAQQAKQESTAWWARFRGPNGSGVAERNKPPVQFGRLRANCFGKPRCLPGTLLRLCGIGTSF